MTIFGIAAFTNGILLLILSVLILKRTQKGKAPENLAYILIITAAWSFGYFAWQGAETEAAADFWIRVMMAPTMFVPLFYSKFILKFLERQKFNRLGLYLAWTFGVIFSMGTLLGYLNDGVESKVDYVKYSPNAGILFMPFVIFFFVSLFYYVVLMLLHYHKASPLVRVQIKYIVFGTIFTYIGIVTNYFLWYDIVVLPIGNFFLTFFLFVAVYSFLSRHAPDPRLILRKSLVNLISLSILIAVIVVLKVLAIKEIPKYASLVDLFILTHAVFIYPRLKKIFYKISNKYFFTSLYEPSEVIAELTDKLNSTLEIDAIMGHIYTIFSSAFHMESLAVLSYEKARQRYVMEYKIGFPNIKRKFFPVIPYLHERYIKRNHPIVVDEIKFRSDLSESKDFMVLASSDVEIIMPLNVGKKTFGIIVLGRKMTKEIYNDDDLKFLKTMSEQIALAIDNALQYQQLKNFNKTLEEEVARQTRELREANEELKKLDKAKSEFITLASHQLRTPLTAIRGFLDLLMTGMYGKYNAKIGDVLRKTASATDRLNNLVEDLLMLSKIEANNLQLTKTSADLHELMAELGRKFVPIAKGKKIDYVMEIPASLPKLELDKDKIRMVIANIIDNAIRYSDRGNVSVKIANEGKLVRIMVTDSGGGISAEEMPHLFEKFMRGEKQKRIYVDGVGIGLYIGKEIVKAHGGKIWAKSKEGKGSTFVIELPVAA